MEHLILKTNIFPALSLKMSKRKAVFLPPPPHELSSSCIPSILKLQPLMLLKEPSSFQGKRSYVLRQEKIRTGLERPVVVSHSQNTRAVLKDIGHSAERIEETTLKSFLAVATLQSHPLHGQSEVRAEGECKRPRPRGLSEAHGGLRRWKYLSSPLKELFKHVIPPAQESHHLNGQLVTEKEQKPMEKKGRDVDVHGWEQQS